MKYIIILVGILMVIAYGCTTTKYVPVEVSTTTMITKEYRDTICRVELESYHDTITTGDTISYLKNIYCASWAKVVGGMLQHSLYTLDSANVDVKVEKEVVLIEKEVPVIVEKEKELSLSERTMIRYFPISFVCNILLFFVLLLFLKKRWRKTISVGE